MAYNQTMRSVPDVSGAPRSVNSALDQDLGFTLGVIFRAYIKAANAVVCDIPGGPRGYQVLSTPRALLTANGGIAWVKENFKSIADDHYAAWPGWIAGVVCAAVAIAATRPLLARVRGRLDRATAATVPIYTEGSAALLAVLSVVAPPVGPIALAGLLWLLFAGRRREGQKYAGLRILR